MSTYRFIKASVILILALTCMQCVQEKGKVSDNPKKIIGPYVQRMADDEVTIAWSTFEGETEIGQTAQRK